MMINISNQEEEHKSSVLFLERLQSVMEIVMKSNMFDEEKHIIFNYLMIECIHSGFVYAKEKYVCDSLVNIDNSENEEKSHHTGFLGFFNKLFS